MEQIGYSLVDESGHEIQFWGDTEGQCVTIPNPIFLANGDQVHAASLGPIGDGNRLVLRLFQYGDSESIAFDGTNIVVTRVRPS